MRTSPICYLIGQGNLLLECAKLLQTRSFLIKGIISPSVNVKEWAQRQQIDWFPSLSQVDWQEKPINYLFSIVNNEIIPVSVLQKFHGLVINYHDAPLPRYGGSNATSWAILNNETTHGITWHIVDELIDGGDVLKQFVIPVSPDETPLSLDMKCIEQAITSFSELVDELLNNSYQQIPQDLSQRTYFLLSQKPSGNGWIDWHSSAEEIERLWRATQFGDYRNRFTLAKMRLNEKVFIINSLTVSPEPPGLSPGTVMEIGHRYWKIATKTHNVLISSLSTAQGKSVELDVLANQYHIKVGTQLLSPTRADKEQFSVLSQQCFPHEAYWIEKLKSFEATPITSQEAEVNLQTLPASLYSRFLDFAQGATNLPLVVLAAWLVYLRRLENKTQLGVSIRLPHPFIPTNLTPFFATYLPLSIVINDNNNFEQLIKQIQQECHQLSQKKTYLTDCWQRYPELVELSTIDKLGYSFNLESVTVYDDESDALIPKPFLTLCEELVSHPHHPIKEVSWVTQQECQQLLFDWNTTDTLYPTEKTIHGLFEEQVSKTPHHIALIAQDVQLTYQDLNNQANQLAHYLLTHQAIQPDQLIAVYLERTHWMLIALLGILKSGGAYVPLEPNYPAKQIEYILDGANIRVVVTTQTQAQQLRRLPNMDWQRTRLLVLDQPDFLATLKQQFTANPVTSVNSRHLAYVMYSSGTTGNPKGIQIEHQGIVNQITWMNHTYPLRTTDRVLQRTPYVFDVSVWELFLANLFGAIVVFAKPEGHKEPDYLIQLIQKEQISIIQFTPSMLNEFIHELANKKASLPSLRHLFCIGEVLTATTVDQVHLLLPEVEIHNIYGPTEASINVLSYDCLPQQPVLIGKPIANTRAYVLDEQCRLVPVGVSGELYLAGVGLARGYLNQAELTTQKFIPNPFQTEQDKKTGQYSRLYKTGDLARWLPNGQLDYLGRNDTQIKLRGYRIELSGIESCLNRYPGIKQPVVALRQFKNSNHPYLVGYYIAQEKLKEEDIFFYLKEHLPEYMVPTYLVQLDAIPLTVNGKIDKKLLPEPVISDRQSYVPPETELENQLVSIWSTVIDVPKKHIGVTDSFFKLGGNSLLIIKLKNQLSQLSSFESITVADLFKYSTIRQLSQKFERHSLNVPVRVRKTYSTQETEIAIISASGAFSGGSDLEHYWHLIQSGKEGIQFYGLDECGRAGVSEDLLHNPLFIPSSGHIPNIDQFDAEFWGISPKEAKNLDPQIRLFLEHCWYALEEGGYLDSRQQANIGVFAAAGQQRYCPNSSIFPLATNDALAPQVSYFLGLTGPANNINTACSGSLVTVVEACKNLAGGYCDLALAGGVSLLLPQERGYVYQEGMIYSHDGHCRVFDAQSSGTVFGSGVGVVLLKRLSEAKRDNDPIIGVIKGYASNNDGNRKISYTAPSVLGQKECIINAQEMAGITSEIIDYVECHGTGTKLGDPIEVQALDEAFKCNVRTPRIHPCVLGSVKANIGHADTAAGIAGLIKVCKMLENQLIPPQINYAQLNPELHLDSTYFTISPKAQEWKTSAEKLRVAAVSSFGIGGTNAHVIVAEPSSGMKRDSYKNAKSSGFHFNKKSYWLESNQNKSLSEQILLTKDEWISAPIWKRLGQFPCKNKRDFSQTVFLIFKNKDDASFDALSTDNNQVIFVDFNKTINKRIEFSEGNRFTIHSVSENVYEKLFSYLENRKIKPDIVIHATTLGIHNNSSEGEIDNELERGFYSLFLIQKYILTSSLAPLKFIILTQGIAQITGRDSINSCNAAMVGALRTIKHELPGINSCIVDCSDEPLVLNNILEFISKESHFTEENLYAIKFQSLWMESLELLKDPFLSQENIIKNGDVILITGGLGGIGLTIASHIAQKYKVTFVLVGRNIPLNVDDKTPNSTIFQLEKIKSQGCLVDIRRVDVGNLSEVESLIEAINIQYHQLSGVIHAAGIAPLSIHERSFENVKVAIRAKVHGSAYLLKAVRARKINYFVLMSSLASIMGDVNRIEYCAANSSLDYLANSNEFLEGCRVVSLNWPMWTEVGMAAKQTMIETSTPHQHLENSTLNTINPSEGAELFDVLLQQTNYSQCVISKLSIPLLKKQLFRNGQEIFSKVLENNSTRIIETNLSKLHYQIAQLFVDILGVEKCSVHDSFFDLGGNSLDAIDLLSQLQKMNISLDLSDLAVHNSVYRIVYFHANNPLQESPHKIVLPLSVHHQSNKDVFFIHPVGGTVLLYLDIVKDLTKEYNYYGIQNINISGRNLLKTDNLETLSEIYVKEILKIQSDGEYILMGSSMGGTIAYEMAIQLIRMGKKVKFVAMFDSWAFFSNHFNDKSNFTNSIKHQTEKYKHLFSSFEKTDVLLEASWNLMSLLLNYRPKKGVVNIHLYKAEKLDEDHVTNGAWEDNGWQQYTSLPLIIRSIPGTHMTMHFGAGRNKLVTYLDKSLRALLEGGGC